MPKNVELVKAKKLSKIPYSDKPLSRGGKIVEYSPEEFKKFIGDDQFEYTESVWGDPEQLKEYKSALERGTADLGVSHPLIVEAFIKGLPIGN